VGIDESTATAPEDDEHFRALREQMVESQIRRRGIVDERVLAAMARVPRHPFVPRPLRARSYDDSPLPIGHQQTISQPLMIATMLEAMELRGTERVLEVGAGCGYQAALLAELAATVVTIEIIAELVDRARHNLDRLGYQSVEVAQGDGSCGYLPGAPYDAIVVAAAPQSVPPPLVEQLAPGGRLLIPVGSWVAQDLERIRKAADGTIEVDRLGGCLFVPLVGEHGRRGP
jgi:protein-L-isoaspartate(D-aspartate) O-methyltransferase